MTTPTPSPTQAEHPSPPARRATFQERMAIYLMPYFLRLNHNLDLARADAMETLASYGARTRAELLHAVAVIAFSLSALDMLAESKAMEMSPAMRLRFRGCANGLNRSSQQNQNTLSKRLTCDPVGGKREPTATPTPTDEPLDDLSEQETAEALRLVHAEIESYRNRLSPSRPATGPHAMPPQRNPSQRQRGSAMFNALADAMTPPRPAAVPT